MRIAVFFALATLVLSACSNPDDAPAAPFATPETVERAAPPASDPASEPDSPTAYTGEWAAAVANCADERQVWTIEAHRMAIVPAMRFCAFNDIYVNAAANQDATTFSAAANCLAEGRETKEFVFFRVKDNQREMRVTFNDASAVKLVRCPMRS